KASTRACGNSCAGRRASGCASWPVSALGKVDSLPRPAVSPPFQVRESYREPADMGELRTLSELNRPGEVRDERARDAVSGRYVCHRGGPRAHDADYLVW